jgi:hypothetical protein
MAANNNFTVQPIDYASLRKRMAIGGTIALFLITVFIFPSMLEPKPDWPTLWMIRPLIVVPFAGATGGACNYFLLRWGDKQGLNKTFVYILSVLIFIIGLWMGTVLGLDGTLWD